LLDFFDYIFYKFYSLYYKKERDESSSRTGALLIISLLHTFNLLTVIFFIFIITHQKPIINKFYGLIPLILFIVFNGIRYNKDKYDYKVLEEKWNNEQITRKFKKEILVALYVILSFLFFFGLAIYLGSKKW